MPIYETGYEKGTVHVMKIKSWTIYIASKFHSRYRLRPIKKQLQALGFTVTSKWMDPDFNIDPSTDVDSLGANLEASKAEAESDSIEIEHSDIFIIDTQDISESGGREVELGMAMRDGCHLFRVGPIRNAFHAMVDGYAAWEVLIPHLTKEFPNEKA